MLVVISLAVSVSLGQTSAPLPIEREAARVLADKAQTFYARADLADRLRAALANPDVEEVRGSIPLETDATKVEPYRTWLELHRAGRLSASALQVDGFGQGGAAHVKLPASSTLPDPRYVATWG